ncbi:helix-turn-helix domain-containing protein [Flavobacterium sp.]|uniref:helix-turn-helix domain-containing protein n=1 Tax=Flavobacterium sp. TaxID=239 RepID=UPI0037519B57
MNVKIRNLREQRKISQAEMGSLLNISQPQYQRKESGFADFNEEEFDILAEHFDVAKDELRDERVSQHNYKQKGGIAQVIYYIADKLVDEVKDLNSILKSELLDTREENKNLKLLIEELRKSNQK